jgi:hypothetical protein
VPSFLIYNLNVGFGYPGYDSKEIDKEMSKFRIKCAYQLVNNPDTCI